MYKSCKNNIQPVAHTQTQLDKQVVNLNANEGLDESCCRLSIKESHHPVSINDTWRHHSHFSSSSDTWRYMVTQAEEMTEEKRDGKIDIHQRYDSTRLFFFFPHSGLFVRFLFCSFGSELVLFIEINAKGEGSSNYHTASNVFFRPDILTWLK